ncbi:unnamed protein product [Cercospora beticola]|nr:unnamed protein product [Cercospora beticola]
MSEDARSTIYEALKPENGEFRLLRLLPESCGELLHCEVQSFSIHDESIPIYNAVSYQWGHDSASYEIQLNGQSILVRKNLYRFLLQMNSENRKDWYFVDALCTNQDDYEEKASQVKLMGQIYRDAEVVIAWIQREPFHPVSTMKFVYDEEPESDTEKDDSLEQLKLLVLHSTYWSRLWIVQEVLLAKRLTIRIGKAEVEWTNLLPESNIFEKRARPKKNGRMLTQQVGDDPMANAAMAIHLLSWRRFERHNLRAGRHFSFHKAVDFFAMQVCTRPHDKIFGILGIANSRIRVDYSLSIMELFMMVLADYFLSLGFLTDDWKTLRRRWDFMAVHYSIKQELNLIAPFLAFGLDPFHPVVYLVIHEIAEFFVPGWGEALCGEAIALWWWSCRPEANMASRIEEWIATDDSKFEFKWFANICLSGIKLVGSELRSFSQKDKATRIEQKQLKEKNAEMLAPEQSGESKRYAEWVALAKEISQTVWERFQESGEDVEGDMDDEAWTMIG